jgi:hypothetical protein
MPELFAPNDPFDSFRDEVREFGFPESTQKILEGANPIYWKLAIRAHYDPLVFTHLYSNIEESIKSQAVFDAMLDFLDIRRVVVEREQAIENERQHLIDSLGSQFESEKKLGKPGLALALSVAPVRGLPCKDALGEDTRVTSNPPVRLSDWIETRKQGGFNLAFVQTNGLWHLAFNGTEFPNSYVKTVYHDENLSKLFDFHNVDPDVQNAAFDLDDKTLN